MTEEEIEKEAKDIICHNCKWNECDNNACPTLQETIEAIELGLEEGRKEKCLEQNNDGTIRPCEVMKENEELKEQNKTILEDNDNLNKWIDELKTQIEKMKSFLNCKNESGECFDKNCYGCKNWELAE